MKKHDIDAPLERAATLGVIGGGKMVKPVSTPSTPTQGEKLDKEQETKGKRERKGQSVYLPPELIRYLKYQAADRELEISEVAEEAIREHRERHQG